MQACACPDVCGSRAHGASGGGRRDSCASAGKELPVSRQNRQKERSLPKSLPPKDTMVTETVIWASPYVARDPQAPVPSRERKCPPATSPTSAREIDAAPTVFQLLSPKLGLRAQIPADPVALNWADLPRGAGSWTPCWPPGVDPGVLPAQAARNRGEAGALAHRACRSQQPSRGGRGPQTVKRPQLPGRLVPSLG